MNYIHIQTQLELKPIQLHFSMFICICVHKYASIRFMLSFFQSLIVELGIPVMFAMVRIEGGFSPHNKVRAFAFI